MGQPGTGEEEGPRRDGVPADGEPSAGESPGSHRALEKEGRHHLHTPHPSEFFAPAEDTVASLVGAAFGGSEPSTDRRQADGGLIRQVGGRRLRLARLLVRLAPWLLVAAGLFFDALLPARFSAAPFFTGAPLVAAPFYALRVVLLIDVVSVGGVAVRTYQRHTIDDVNGITQLFTIVTVALFAVLINRVVHRGYVMLTSARQIAVQAQRAVLPDPLERLAGLDVAAHYEAAQAGAFIGGDFYATQDTAHGVRFVLGDVRGKGMGAVAAVSVLIGAFREAAEQETTLEAVAQRLDHALAREGTRRPKPEGFEEFATAVLAEVPHGHDTVRIVNRGHPPPLLLHPDGRVEEPAGSEAALPLGMTDLGSWPDRALEIAFPARTQLLMFTDGLSEARDRRGVFYDPVASLQGRVFDNPHRLLNTVVMEVRRHTNDGGTDDLALLAVRRP